MKVLHEMDNVERGKLLAELFPAELPKLILFVEQQAEWILGGGPERELFSATHPETEGFWFAVAKSIGATIRKYGPRLESKPSLFAAQLFDRQNGLFTVYCLSVYAEKAECDPKLKLAINLLFGVGRNSQQNITKHKEN